MSSWRKAAGIAACAAMMSACGGDSDSRAIPTVSLTTQSLHASADFSEAAPAFDFTLTVQGVKDVAVFASITHEQTAVADVDLVWSQFVGNAAANPRADVRVRLRAPTEMPEGTATDAISIRVCMDIGCATEAVGSPLRVPVTYRVTAATIASIDTEALHVQAGEADSSLPLALVTIDLAHPPANPPMVQSPARPGFIQGFDIVHAPASIQLRIYFQAPRDMTPGVHSGDMLVDLCYDFGCTRRVAGGAFTIAVTYAIEETPDASHPPLPYLTRHALAHDVIDAKYSKALDAVVMVSSQPAPALHVYEVYSGIQRQVALPRSATAVAVSPDGLSAVVGHNALLSHVDLTTVGLPGSPPLRMLNVSAWVHDVVLDGRGQAHAVPAAPGSAVQMHTVDVHSNTEYIGSDPIFLSRAALHPSGDTVYIVPVGLSPDRLQRFAIFEGAAAEHVRFAPMREGQYACGRPLWFSEEGGTIYTGCGNLFLAADDQELDMTHAGTLELSNSAGEGHAWQVRSLSHSAGTREIALIEERSAACYDNAPACRTRLHLYDSESHQRTARYSLPRIDHDGQSHAQVGLFVFHGADGLGRFMLSRLHDGESAASSQPHFLTILQ